MRCFVFAGEASGDSHGADLITSLQKQIPGLEIDGVFGPKMRGLGLEPFMPMETFQVMGIGAVIKALPRLQFAFRRIVRHILNTNPDLVVLIDYPGFNIRLAKYLRDAGFKNKITHFVCPSVWAWKQGRIQQMAKTLDLLLCILPFEPTYFERTALPTHYIGNPSLELVGKYAFRPEWKQALGIDEDKKILSLFPGSREEEIERNLPLQLRAAERLLQTMDNALLCISAANPKAEEIIWFLRRKVPACIVPASYTHELMHDSMLSIATCGTIVLELALHAIPTVVTYKLSTLNALIGKYLFHLDRVPFFSLPNILLEKEVFPELIHDECSEENICARAKQLLLTPVRERCMRDCRAIRQLLATSESASLNAAKSLVSLFSE